MGASVIVGQDFEPALFDHTLDGSAQSGGVELEQAADLSGPSDAQLGRDRQDVSLTELDSERSQRFVIQVRNDAAKQPDPPAMQDAAMVSIVVADLVMASLRLCY